ncbi:MAG: hypothetical protein JO297_01915, partial [Nitrososphaeraceae archaeon]|nr:hypothetical protein [Nitrososphaeraceae archaeon]
NMWNQSELHQHISQAYERLKIDDTMHKEFINVAAHILRNPIQPILGLTVRETVFQNLQSDKSQDKTMNLAVYAILIICWTSNTVEYG